MQYTITGVTGYGYGGGPFQKATEIAGAKSMRQAAQAAALKMLLQCNVTAASVREANESRSARWRRPGCVSGEAGCQKFGVPRTLRSAAAVRCRTGVHVM
jgi:hypothetical protein